MNYGRVIFQYGILVCTACDTLLQDVMVSRAHPSTARLDSIIYGCLVLTHWTWTPLHDFLGIVLDLALHRNVKKEVCDLQLLLTCKNSGPCTSGQNARPSAHMEKAILVV